MMTCYRFFVFPYGITSHWISGYHSNHVEITNISLKDKLFKSPNVKYDSIDRFKKCCTLST